jgi:translation initiation factor 4E
MSSNKFQPLAAHEDEILEEFEKHSDKADNTSNMTKESKKSLKCDVIIPPGEHRLQSSYCLWYSRKAKVDPHSYDQNMKLVATFTTVEQFWKIYSHVVRPNSLHSHGDLHVFKEGIKPLWEHEANKQGGRWLVHIRKELANRCWENILMAMLGEQFMVGEEVCGAMVSVRSNEDIISVWNRTADDEAVKSRIRDTFRRVLNLPPTTVIQYQKFW